MKGGLVFVGGLDPTGGAGLLRDVWTVRSLGASEGDVVGCVVSSLTWQGETEFVRAEATDTRYFVHTLDRCLARAPSVVKIGLLPAAHVEAMRAALLGFDGQVVLDPVMWTGRGSSFGVTAESLRSLFPLVNLVTPNRQEAASLFGSDLHAMESALGSPRSHVLQKGIDLGTEIEDRLIGRDRVHTFRRPKVPGPDPRGTGCALASAVAWSLGRGETLEDAVKTAVTWLDQARTRLVMGRDRRLHLALSCP